MPPQYPPQQHGFDRPASQAQSQQNRAQQQQHTFGPFPKGRKGLVERSSLIRHASQKTPGRSEAEQNRMQNNERNITNIENQTFLKDVRVFRYKILP